MAFLKLVHNNHVKIVALVAAVEMVDAVVLVDAIPLAADIAVQISNI